VQRRWTCLVRRALSGFVLWRIALLNTKYEVKAIPPMSILDSLTGARADGPPRDETFADLGLPPTICRAIASAGIT
jgi:hypothetical protein